MGKRSDFERAKNDFYPTPKAAVLPLLPYLPANLRYCEPCAGDGALIRHLATEAHRCVAAYDIDPQGPNIFRYDATFLLTSDLCGAEAIITNPPWDRRVLHQIIERCAALAPTWLLFDADWMHTKQSVPHMEICRKIVSIGRVQWIEGSGMSGKDNCCWYLFDIKGPYTGAPTFHGRR